MGRGRGEGEVLGVFFFFGINKFEVSTDLLTVSIVQRGSNLSRLGRRCRIEAVTRQGELVKFELQCDLSLNSSSYGRQDQIEMGLIS